MSLRQPYLLSFSKHFLGYINGFSKISNETHKTKYNEHEFKSNVSSLKFNYSKSAHLYCPKNEIACQIVSSIKKVGILTLTIHRQYVFYVKYANNFHNIIYDNYLGNLLCFITISITFFSISIVGNSLLDSLNTKLEVYKRQRIDSEKSGNISSARRKARRILQYKEAIEKVKLGLEIDVDKLPNPLQDTPVHPETVQPACPETQINTDFQVGKQTILQLNEFIAT